MMNWSQSIPMVTIQAQKAAQEAAALQQLQSEIGPAWELKILHSTSHAFISAEHITAAVTQEARAGWEMIGQWDDSRLIFKRLAQVGKSEPSQTGLNPYRETYSAPVDLIQGFVGAVLLLGTLVGLAIVLSTSGQ